MSSSELDKRLAALEAKVTAMQKDIDALKRPCIYSNWVPMVKNAEPPVEEDDVFGLFS